MSGLPYSQLISYQTNGTFSSVLDTPSVWPDWDGDEQYESGDDGLTTGPYLGVVVINGIEAPVFEGRNANSQPDGFVVIYPGPALEMSDIPQTMPPLSNTPYSFPAPTDGDDYILGSDDDDHFDMLAGADTVLGEDGNDTINGGGGKDRLEGGNDDDSLSGGKGKDRLFGDDDDDTLSGGDGNDTLDGGEDDDLLQGKAGDDLLKGGDGFGDDTLTGGDGADTLKGGDGWDDLQGGKGKDVLKGEDGSDDLDGGKGNDTLTGGEGSDDFVFSKGKDVVKDFDALNDGEDIDLSGVASIKNFNDLTNNHMTQTGADVIIDDLKGNTMKLKNVDIADLDANDFLF